MDDIPLLLRGYQAVDFRDPGRYNEQFDVLMAALLRPSTAPKAVGTRKFEDEQKTPPRVPTPPQHDTITDTFDITLLRKRDPAVINRELAAGQMRFLIVEYNSSIVRDVRTPLKIGHFDGTKARPGLDLANYDPSKNGVSREHAVVSPTRNGYAVGDLNSTNGTWLGTMRLQSGKLYNLKNDSVIRLGWLLIRVEFLEQQV